MRLIALLGAAAVIVAGCGGGAGSDEIGRLPDVDLAPLDGAGAPLELADMTGPAVINLWATWCAPCRRELPAFQEVSTTRPDVAFIGVDMGEDAEASRQFLARLEVAFPQYVDEDAELSDALGVASLPVTLFVSADGGVRTHLGPIATNELQEALDGLE